MIKALPALAVLQEMFALLFSNCWIARWQQAQPPAAPRAAAKKKARPRARGFTSASSRCA